MALALFAGTAAAQTVIDGSYPEDAPLTLEEANRLVTADFRDPLSAQYRQISFHEDETRGTIMCGWVNAKNGYGGYTDFYPFYVTLKDGDANVATDYRNPNLAKLVSLPFQFVGCYSRLGMEDFSS